MINFGFVDLYRYLVFSMFYTESNGICLDCLTVKHLSWVDFLFFAAKHYILYTPMTSATTRKLLDIKYIFIP